MTGRTLSREVCWLKHQDGATVIWEYECGLAMAERNGKWLGWKTQKWIDERDYFSAWADFARGTWVKRVPVHPGVYPVRSLEGFRAKDRTLEMVDGRLVDTSGGFVGADKVSAWLGEWWSSPYPPLR